MARHSMDWDDMVRALEAFKKEQGHCHVPTAWAKNPQLGGWVARQRFRHKIGELPKHYVDRLVEIGFVWAPSDRVWNEFFLRLVKYKGKRGDCDVPTSCPSDPELAHWVVSQRHAKTIGSLNAERERKLVETGFSWALYRKNQSVKTVAVERKSMSTVFKKAEPGSEEHLYLVTGEYIQYGGSGPRPAKLEKYIQLHGGELPPSIILPCKPTVFRHGNPDLARVPVRKIKWSGKGPIPAEVLEYLNENGALPAHS